MGHIRRSIVPTLHDRRLDRDLWVHGKPRTLWGRIPSESVLSPVVGLETGFTHYTTLPFHPLPKTPRLVLTDTLRRLPHPPSKDPDSSPPVGRDPYLSPTTGASTPHVRIPRPTDACPCLRTFPPSAPYLSFGPVRPLRTQGSSPDSHRDFSCSSHNLTSTPPFSVHSQLCRKCLIR